MPVNHDKVSSVDDPPEDVLAGKIVPSDWNTPHNVLIDLAGPEVTGVLPVDKLPPEVVEAPELSPDGLVVVHETVFAGMPTASYANGNTPTLNGLTYNVGIGAGGTVAIVADGLQHTHPTGATETAFALAAPIWTTLLGNSILRRGRFAVWAHVSSYALVSTACWSYILNWGAPYSSMGGGFRRIRNTQGGVATATGSVGAWAYYNGADVANVLSGNAEIVDNGSATNHSALDNVVCAYFRNWYEWDYYYGTWASGWPLLEDMKHGRRFYCGPLINTIEGGQKLRDPRTWSLGLGGGGASSNIGNGITIARWRMTYWNP